MEGEDQSNTAKVEIRIPFSFPIGYEILHTAHFERLVKHTDPVEKTKYILLGEVFRWRSG